MRATRGGILDAVLATALLMGCEDPTSAILRVRYDCSLDPEAVSRIVFYLEPAPESPSQVIPGLTAGIVEQGGIRVMGDDIDADGLLEYVVIATRAGIELDDGFALRVVRTEEVGGVFLVRAIAGNDDGLQLGYSDPAARLQFRAGESVPVSLHLRCSCNGMDGCGGSCEGDGVDPGCRAPAPELCHDSLDNDGDGATDCVDFDCRGRGPCQECDEERCDNLIDDDCDKLVDCWDLDCEAHCRDKPREVCDDGQDNDLDGSPDCLDAECAFDQHCVEECNDPVSEQCSNHRDDDCDGLVDCLDREDCGAQTPETETACRDGVDNDCDGRADCGDPDCYDCFDLCEEPEGCPDRDCRTEGNCAGELGCICCATVESEAPGLCRDGLDNDCDGYIDCDDVGCNRPINLELDCHDGIDDNCDHAYDCDDETCRSNRPAGYELSEICDDGIDNDCDGLPDCGDQPCCLMPDCEGRVPAEANCGDRLDNDCDDKIDCEDTDCAGRGPREICTDGIDNDCDAQTDCSDPECRGVLSCPQGGG